MGVSRNPAGPLSTAVLGRINETIFFGPTQPPDIAPMDSDIVYMVKMSDRLDNLAYRFLGDEQKGWTILHRNNMRLVPNDLVPGVEIFIPTRESLRKRGIVE